MRTKYAIKNISINIFSQIIIILLGFVSRKIFLDNLGAEYLGINGLLTNVLSAMVLIEGGIGISITYNLYKPLAENDKDTIIALVQLYKKAYTILAIIIFTICLVMFPFIKILIKSGDNIKGINVVYWIFVSKSILSYIFAHKWALINSDQKGYVLARCNLIFQVLAIISKIAILIISKNYIIYLAIEVILFIVQNMVNSNIVNKRYPYINTKNKYVIEENVRDDITKNVKAMFIQNIGSYAIFSTDNIIISALISIKSVGLYSNYSMVMGQLAALLGPIIGGISNGVGNLIATENNKKTYSVFKVANFVAFWIYSWCSIFLFVLLEPFINWWLGEGYLLEEITFLILLINFYMSGMRSVINIFKSKAGMFAQDKYAPIVEGAINIVASIFLIKYLGLAGVFLGTTISFLSISFWNQPRILFKELFKRSLWVYFAKYIFYLLVTLITGIITINVCSLFIDGYSFMSLCARGIICLIIPNVIYLALFYKTEEFKYLLGALKGQISNIGVFNKIINLS